MYSFACMLDMRRHCVGKMNLPMDGFCTACHGCSPEFHPMLHKSGVPSMWRDGRFTYYLHFFSYFYLVIKTILLPYLLSCFFYWDLKRTLHLRPPRTKHAGRCQVENYWINDITDAVYEIFFHCSCCVHSDWLLLLCYWSLQNFLMREKMLLFYKVCERTMVKIKIKMTIQI